MKKLINKPGLWSVGMAAAHPGLLKVEFDPNCLELMHPYKVDFWWGQWS